MCSKGATNNDTSSNNTSSVSSDKGITPSLFGYQYKVKPRECMILFISITQIFKSCQQLR